MQQRTGTDDGRTVVLPAIFDREAAAALLPELRDAVRQGPTLLDGRPVERIGQTGLQLILGTLRSAPSGARVIACSAALQRAAELAGLDEVLALPEAEFAA